MKWEDAKKYILNFSKNWLYKFLIKKIFGGAIGGVWGWVVSLVFDYGWKKAIQPFLNWLFRKGKTYYQRKKNNKKLKDLEDAKTEKEWDEASDNIP